MPQLVALHAEWQRLFAGDSAAPALGAAGGAAAAPPLSAEAKEALLLEALQELVGGFIEMARRRLQADAVARPQVSGKCGALPCRLR